MIRAKNPTRKCNKKISNVNNIKTLTYGIDHSDHNNKTHEGNVIKLIKC